MSSTNPISSAKLMPSDEETIECLKGFPRFQSSKVSDPGQEARDFTVKLSMQRHGESEANVAIRLQWEQEEQDWSKLPVDPVLTALGHCQAAISASDYISSVISGKAEFPEVLLSSRLERAKQTARWLMKAVESYISSDGAKAGLEMPFDIEVEGLGEIRDVITSKRDPSRSDPFSACLLPEGCLDKNADFWKDDEGDSTMKPFEARCHRISEWLSIIGAFITERTKKSECRITLVSHQELMAEMAYQWTKNGQLEKIVNCQTSSFTLKCSANGSSTSSDLQCQTFRNFGPKGTAACDDPATTAPEKEAAKRLHDYLTDNGIKADDYSILGPMLDHIYANGSSSKETNWAEVFEGFKQIMTDFTD